MTDPPMDETDYAILDRLAALHARLDPPPADLDDRVSFAIGLDDLEAEVARLAPGHLAVAGVRDGEQSRTITFDADSRTIMITIVDRPDGLVRMDGWLAPGADLHVELRLAEPEASRTATADHTGRFVFDAVPRGLAQLVVHPATSGGRPVVTPSVVL